MFQFLQSRACAQVGMTSLQYCNEVQTIFALWEESLSTGRTYYGNMAYWHVYPRKNNAQPTIVLGKQLGQIEPILGQ